jgi:hypothetical protein
MLALTYLPKTIKSDLFLTCHTHSLLAELKTGFVAALLDRVMRFCCGSSRKSY